MLGVLYVGAIFWVCLDIARLFKLEHSEIVWHRLINLGQVPFNMVFSFSFMCGIALCLLQFIPEIKRFKLCLHLNFDNGYMMLLHLLFGVLCLGCISFIAGALFFVFLESYFPVMYAKWIILHFSIYAMGGVLLYLCGAILILEPRRKMRFFFALIAFALLYPLYYYAPSAVGGLFWVYFILIFMMMFVSVIAVLDFRLRKNV